MNTMLVALKNTHLSKAIIERDIEKHPITEDARIVCIVEVVSAPPLQQNR